jgi:hypothetical protein
VFLRAFTVRAGGAKIMDSWNLPTGPERRREVPRPVTKGPILTPRLKARRTEAPGFMALSPTAIDGMEGLAPELIGGGAEIRRRP